jgi:hypothetical protein
MGAFLVGLLEWVQKIFLVNICSKFLKKIFQKWLRLSTEIVTVFSRDQDIITATRT